MFKFKLPILVIVTVLFFSVKVYAIEHVISLGGAPAFTTQNFRIEGSTKKYNHVDKTTMVADFLNKTSNSKVLPEFAFEYQARFNLVTLGLGISAAMGNFSNSYKSPLYNNENTIKESRTLVNVSPTLLFNILKLDKFTLSSGLGINLGSLSIKSKSDNKISAYDKNLSFAFMQAKFILDGDFSINEKFSIFSRFSVAPKLLSIVQEREETAYIETKTDIEIIKDKEVHKPIETTLIKQTITPKIENISLTFGVRYKF